MRHTLTAVFDDRGDAQHALNKLLAAGFLRADATLSLIAPAGQGATMRGSAHGLGLLARQLFAQLPAIGSAAQHANDTGPHPGRHLLTLTTASEPEADRAFRLVGGFVFADGDPGRPIAHSPHATGPSYSREHVSEPARGNKARDSLQSHMRHWTALAAGRKANWAARHLGELPPWERFKDALLHGWGRISLGNEDKEGAGPARDAAATDSDDPSPAYRYGDEMAHSGQFPGLRWDEAENALHDAWDSRYGERGFASWDENKAAVRQGWERTHPLPGASAR